jgi:hypothetical protein
MYIYFRYKSNVSMMINSTDTTLHTAINSATDEAKEHYVRLHNSYSSLLYRFLILFDTKNEIVGVSVCSIIAQEWINRFAPNLAYFFLETKKKS